MEKMPYGILI